MENQEAILRRLTRAVEEQGLEIKLNDCPITITKRVVIDVEHNESGIFVSCGVLFVPSNYVYYCTNLCTLSKLIVPTYSEIIGHNVVSDVELLRFWGINVTQKQVYWDTMLIGHIIDSSIKDYSLKNMAARYVQIVYPTYDEIVGKKTKKQKNPRVTLDKQPAEIVSQYNALDVWSTYKLYEKQAKVLGVPGTTIPVSASQFPPTPLPVSREVILGRSEPEVYF